MAKKVNTSQMMKNGKNHGNFKKKNEEADNKIVEIKELKAS